jgi:recombination protein RecT
MAYLTPYENNKKLPDGSWMKVLEAQFQIGYHGIIHLMWQSGMLADIHWSKWHKSDLFEVHEGTEKKLIHRPELFKPRGDIIGYYAVAKTKFGGSPFDFMTVPELIEHGKKFSKGYEKSGNIWQKNFDGASFKTVLKQVSKYMPKTADREAIRFNKAMMADNTIKHELDGDMTDVHDVTEYSVVEDETQQLIENFEASNS